MAGSAAAWPAWCCGLFHLYISPEYGKLRPPLPTLLASEGGSCNKPGAETYHGAARVTNPHWSGWPAVDAVKGRLSLPQPVPQADWHQLTQTLGAD